MIRTLLCFFGWHEWHWKLGREGIPLHGNPPNHAKCKYCNISYGRTQ